MCSKTYAFIGNNSFYSLSCQPRVPIWCIRTKNGSIRYFFDCHHIEARQSSNTKISSSVRKIAAPILGKTWKILRAGDLERALAEVETYTLEQKEKIQQSLCGKHGAERIIVVQHQLGNVLLDIVNNVIPYVWPGMVANSMLKKAFTRQFGNEAEATTGNDK